MVEKKTEHVTASMDVTALIHDFVTGESTCKDPVKPDF